MESAFTDHAPLRSWESLKTTKTFEIARCARYIKATLLVPHLVLSTSTKNGGQQRNLRVLVNHQSCEGKDHGERQRLIKELGLERYHDRVCDEMEIDAATAAVMGTAANMNYASIVSLTDRDLAVTAVVTAGVQGNACCAGEPAGWREEGGTWLPINPLAGTINTMVLINRELCEGALARAAITMTEAKSAALTRLAVGSLYSHDMATGTGTDQYCIGAACTGEAPLTSTSPHVLLGELIGRTVRDATLEALRWQNGMEPSYTRGVFHALGRFGLRETSVYERLADHLDEQTLEMLRQNAKSVFYEPMVSAAAYAFAAVIDRVRYQTLPPSIAKEALRHQGACLAVALAAKPDRWSEFRNALPEPQVEDPTALVLAAIALGWKSKWI